MTAFDTHRPPLLSDIETCVHCGFCLPTCPTYTPLWNEEMDSPRGRIVLMAEGLEPDSSFSDELALHLDRCLGCMACVTACPSGVRYDRLIERARPQVERHRDRSAGERLFRRLVFATFTHPSRLRRLRPLVALERSVGVGRRLLPAGSRLGALARLGRGIAPRRPPRLPERLPAVGERRATVGLLQGCVQRVFFGHVNDATARVLAAEGYEVVVPKAPRCCGALQLHTGYEEEARERAKETIEAFQGCDVVCVNAAGCGSSMKSYGELFSDEPAWVERAEEFAGRVRDFSELVVEPVAPRREVPLRVAYHDACHLAHAQGIRAEPRAALRSIPGLELVEPAEWAICCGSAGIWNLLNPEPAAELGRRKAANLMATRPDAIAAANPGCALQIAAHLERKLPIYHPSELLLMAIEGRGGGG